MQTRSPARYRHGSPAFDTKQRPYNSCWRYSGRASPEPGHACAYPFRPGPRTVINDLPDLILRQVGEGTSLHARYSFVDAAGVAWDRDNWTGALIERPAPAWEEPVDESTAGEAD